MTENQIYEMFRIMNKTITKIDDLETSMVGLETKFDGLINKFDEANEKRKFRQETKQNFDEVNQKLRFMNTRTEVVLEDLMQNKMRLRDVEKRVDILEQKDAA